MAGLRLGCPGSPPSGRAPRSRLTCPPGARPLWVLALVFVLAVAGVPLTAAEIAGITVSERAQVGASDLVLNGAGLRRRLVFKVYVVGLYLVERRQSPEDVLALGGAKRLTVVLLRSLTARELVDALRLGVSANTSPAELMALDGRLGALEAVLLAIRRGERGDVIDFDWIPGTGTAILINGQPRGEPLAGEDLYRALLRVWLGERPTSGGLKKALLGRTD